MVTLTNKLSTIVEYVRQRHVKRKAFVDAHLISGKLLPCEERADKERDYKKEYQDYHSKPEQVKNRAARNAARKKIGLKKGDPREADHIKPLSKGGGNGKGNLRAVSRETNRKKGAGSS